LPALERRIIVLADVAMARRDARRLGVAQGLAPQAIEQLLLAVSELGTNLVYHARTGTILLDAEVSRLGRRGIRVESRDDGPGIPNMAHAMQDGYSTRGGYGNGLPAVRRLMDDFDVTTGPTGTVIVAHKWSPAA
jgi:serine/threonine-protein kinase RsbT